MQRSVIDLVSERISYLSSLRDKQGGKMEIESRIGVHTEKGFSSNIPRAKWIMARDALDKLHLQEIEMDIVSEDFGATNYRKRTIKIGGDVKVVKEGKFSTKPIEDIQNWTRYSFSLEVPVDKIPPTIIVEANIRNIQRKRYVFSRYGCYVDLSRTEKNNTVTHEIEIEIMNPNESIHLQHFMACTRRIIMYMNGTLSYYNYNQLKIFNYAINANLPISFTKNSPDPISLTYNIDRRIMSEARPMTMSDLRHGMIVDGKYVYEICHKTDGVRYFLVLAHHSIWIVSPPYHSNLLTSEVNGLIGTNELTIFDVEVLDPFANVLDIWVLDCLMVAGVNVRTIPSKQGRIQRGKNFMNEVLQRRIQKTFISMDRVHYADVTNNPEISENVYTFPQIFHLYWKDTFLVKSENDLHFYSRKLLEEQPFLSYPTDGLMFTPVNCPYDYEIFFGKDKTKNKPEILKWKSPRQVTIDFRIVKDQNGNTLLLVDNRDSNSDSKEIVFEGTYEIPFDNLTMIDTDSIPESMYGGIGEFHWDSKIRKFIYDKPREFKASANRKAVAISNWLLVNFPVTEETLTGQGLGQLRFYHNKVKSEILSESNGILLDLGSGQGGDVKKWRGKYKIVFTVEPNIEHIDGRDGLRVRATRAGFIERKVGDNLNIPEPIFVVIHTVAQDTQLIVSTIRNFLNPMNDPSISYYVDVVSMMDSGTFFWENPSILKSVVETINYSLKPGGKILWKMMDGDAVYKRFASQLPGPIWKSFSKPLQNGQKLDYGNFSIVSTGIANKIEVTFRDGIVGEKQTEYLTRITDFYGLLGINYSVKSQNRCDNPKDIILTGESLLVSSLYIYGVIEKRDDGTEKGKKSPIYEEEKAPETPYVPINQNQYVAEQPIVPQQPVIQPVIAPRQPRVQNSRTRGGGSRGGRGRRIDLTSRTSGSTYDMIYE